MECDLPAILNTWLDPKADLAEKAAVEEDFRRFFLFFGPAGFAESVQRKALIRRAVEGGSEYRLGVSEGLKGQTFEALRICIEGYLAFTPNELNAATHLD